MRYSVKGKQRKRNRSSPSHAKPCKKVKNPRFKSALCDLGSESDHWSDIDSENTDCCALNQTTSHNTTTSSGKAQDSEDTVNTLQTISVSSALSQPVSQQHTMAMSSAQLQGDFISGPASPSLISAGDQSFTQPPPATPFVAYSGGYQPVQLPNVPSMQMTMPPNAAPVPSLSEFDCMRIAVFVKNMLKDEICSLVKLEVQQATSGLQSQITDLKNSNDVLSKSNKVLSSEVRELTGKLDDLEQYGRRMCIRISGVPEMQGENVNDIVMKLGGDISAEVSRHDIDKAHRVGRRTDVTSQDDGMDHDAAGGATGVKTMKKSRDIIVKFTNSPARMEFLKGRKILREQRRSVFINEDLTATRMGLAFQCRYLKRDKKSKISKTWTYNGNVFVQDMAGTKHKILTEADLESFKPDNQQPPQPDPNQSAGITR